MAHMKLNVAEISSMLDYDFKNDPSEKENMAANGGNNVPDSRRPALYAIEGITGLCKVTEYLPYQVGRYGNKVKAQYEKDPKVKATFYTWSAQLNACPGPSTTTSNQEYIVDDHDL